MELDGINNATKIYQYQRTMPNGKQYVKTRKYTPSNNKRGPKQKLSTIVQKLIKELSDGDLAIVHDLMLKLRDRPKTPTTN